LAQLNKQQRTILNTLLGQARRQGATPRSTKALVEAGLVESGLRNLNHGDRDSLGVLQQRPSQGWNNATNPSLAARDFLARAMRLNAQGFKGSAGELAQAVQGSAFPGRYDQQGGLAASLLGGSGAQGASQGSSTTTTRTTPGVDNSKLRTQLIAQYVLAGQNADALTALAAALPGAADTPGRTVTKTTRPSSGGSSSTSAKGVATFEGKKVAAWIAPILTYARQHGWQGTVNSGYRSLADQTRIYNSGVRPAARPGTSNHEFTAFPGGAIDASDAQTLARILQRSPYANKLVWAGAKDPVHFSHPHNGAY
jgi:hypothetical protein